MEGDAVDAARAVRLHLARSGRTLLLPPDRSMLDVLEQARIHLRHACHSGSCGACETRVLSGTPLHRDPVYTAWPQPPMDRIRPCVSRSASADITLDL